MRAGDGQHFSATKSVVLHAELNSPASGGVRHGPAQERDRSAQPTAVPHQDDVDEDMQQKLLRARDLLRHVIPDGDTTAHGRSGSGISALDGIPVVRDPPRRRELVD
jgi:hypothetical protein